MKPRLYILAGAGIVIALAACSSGSTHSEDARSATAATAEAQSGATAASSDTLGGNNYDPCVKLSKADVAPFFLHPITDVRKQEFAGQAAGCSYDTADGRSAIDITTVTGSQAQRFYDAGAMQDGKPGIPLGNIGDKAVRSAGDVWVTAIRGDVFCSVSGKHGSIAARGTGEIVGLQDYDTNDAIPDSVAQPVALRLAALCQKLFAGT
ncbi:MAG TPA: DUF3558 family protein [Candidatus Tumulicola sp.]|jgi:hypothetical protein